MRVRGERVDGVVAEDVALLKMDVEGFEPTAFESAKGVLDTFKCASRPASMMVCLNENSAYNGVVEGHARYYPCWPSAIAMDVPFSRSKKKRNGVCNCAGWRIS